MAKIILIATILLLSCFCFESKEFLGTKLGFNLDECLEGLSTLPSQLEQALAGGFSLETIETLAKLVPELEALLQDCNPTDILGQPNSDCFTNIAELPNQVNRLVQDLSNGDFEALQADVSSLLALVQQIEACLSA